MKESDVQRLFGKQNRLFGAFELKFTKGKSISFEAVAAHQIKSLLAISNNGLYHKLIDPPIFPGMKTRFNAPRPFDCFNLKDIPAYIVAVFYEPNKKKTAYYIPIEDYVMMQEQVEAGNMGGKPRKSFTEPHAEAYATHVLELKNI